MLDLPESHVGTIATDSRYESSIPVDVVHLDEDGLPFEQAFQGIARLIGGRLPFLGSIDPADPDLELFSRAVDDRKAVTICDAHYTCREREGEGFNRTAGEKKNEQRQSATEHPRRF
jgi:hypothetical protein